MRESFILIVLHLLVIAVRCSNVHDRDSYNLYKDHMRARSRDAPKIDPVVTNLWDGYAPLQGFEYLNMPIWLPEYRKRAANAVKKRMLDNLVQLDERLNKRTSKAALSLMLQSKQDPELMEEENSCFAGK
ncbi:uncharacterized protein [Maniola hyperantus]|uniref:uncharacterized protein isoform X1 n=2 Tax=Aphantopus hyperantus TaxID=2795564 RepID=UPI001568D1F5|nr:uncharacterized protein LOC117985822 [Maniola hyperantus]